MRFLAPVAIGIACLPLGGCGANVVFQGDEGSAGAGGAGGAGAGSCSDISFDFDAPATVCTTSAACELSGLLPDGRTVQETCTIGKTSTCALTIDGEQTCTCPFNRIDFASTCGNGVPTCADWHVDWSDIEPCPVP